MVREFELPDVGEGVAEGELISWLVEPGDRVSEDEPVAEVETDKAVVDVPSPVDGIVEELRAEEGEVVPVGDVIIVFSTDGGDDIDAAAPDSNEESEDATQDSQADDAGQTAADDTESSETAGPNQVVASPSVRRLARKLDVDLANVATSHSGRVSEADVRARANGEQSPAQVSSAGNQQQSSSETASAAKRQAVVEKANRENTLAVPETREVANEKGVDIDDVPTDERRDGEPFVTTEAVREYAERQQRASEESRGTAVSATSSPEQRETREDYSGIRKTIGESMTSSKYTAPHVTHQDEVDVTKLVEARSNLEAEAEEHGISLTYMPFVMKACAAALQDVPQVNVSLDEESEELVKKHYYNIGIATATDAGLMVPVVDGVDSKGLLEVASEANEKIKKARERTISPTEMQGGTFTISNIGGIGGEFGTPIINEPESAILALGEIKKKPRVVEQDGEETIEPRHILTLSLSFDHRVLDGADAARFTNAVEKYLQNPNLLLLE